MNSSTPLPEYLAERAKSIQAQIRAQLPSQTLLSSWDGHPLNPTTLIEYSLLKPRQVEVVSLDAIDLVKAIKEKKYTAVEVVEAYFYSASLAHQATNCLTYFDGEGALEQARELDRYLEEKGKVKGPLHGVVISIKQLINVKGWPQNASHFNFEEFISEEDASLVKILRDAGAIFMCKTTQPQSIMQLETQSHNYGITRNAYNRNCTSGGSSGGEGALVAMRGSTIGVGTDIGGSIRNPAAFNGLWGFKSSSKRLPRDGAQGGLSGGTHHARIRGCIGPLARSRRDMELFMRTIMEAQSWMNDTSLLPLPWRSCEGGKGIGYKGWSGEGGKLRVGVMRDDGRVRPVSSMRRALDGMVEKLRGSMEIVEVEPKFFEESWELVTSLYYIDGGEKLREILGDEPLLPLTEWVVSHSKALSSKELDELIIRREHIRQEYLTYFRSLNLDIILLPPGPAPAQLIGTTKYWSYTSLFNLIDWPAAVFPTGLHVDPKLDLKGDQGIEPRNQDEEHLYKTWSSETSVGCPIGLQVVAPRNEDERLMEALKVIEGILPLSQ